MTDIYLRRSLDGYLLEERIGEGGMGAVYRSSRLDSGQVFAIKLIKRGMDTDAILRRFYNERRILQTLDHRNIARVLDAGATPEGLPYFVMEYIPGQPINRYCDSGRLSIGERLRLFQKVCSAVQCAHEFHVVHRDIKPENILIDAEGEPKLLDFGIAKTLDFSNPSQDATITLTPVMTPHYASPEQARGAPITRATDIYSLGVLLYELLAGVSPYSGRDGAAASLIGSILNERPQPPSAAVARLSPDDPKASSIVADRRTEPAALRRSLAGDLDAIVLTALDKIPERRYASVADFSADIGRHLEGSRVTARKPRAPNAGARRFWTAALALLLALVVVAGIFAVRSRRNARARTGARESVAVLGFENLSRQPSAEWLSTALTEMLSTELAAGGRLRTVPGELVARVKLELQVPNAQTFTMPTLSRLRNSLNADYVVLGSYLVVGEGAGQSVRLDLRLQNTSNGEVAASSSESRSIAELLRLVSDAGALLRRQLGAGAIAAADAAFARGSLPDGEEAAKNYSEGLERLRRFDALSARDLLRNAVTAAPGHALSHAALATASSLLGYDAESRDEARKALDLSATLGREDRLSIEGEYFETTRAWDKAVTTYQTLMDEYPDNLEYGLRLAAAQMRAGDPRRAIDTVRALRSANSSAHDPRIDLAECEAALAAADLKTARESAGRAAAAGSDQGLSILSARAKLLESRIALESGDPKAALAAAAESQQFYLSAGHRQGVAWALNESAGVLTQRGDVAGARARYEEALAVCKTIGDQSCIATDLDSIGVLRRRQGELRTAIDLHKQALEIRRSVGDRAGAATSMYNLGNVLEVIGDLPRAQQAAAEALSIRQQLGERRSAALTMSRLANIRRREGQLNDALQMNEDAVAALRGIGDRGGVAMALLNLGLTKFDLGDPAGSRSAIEEALAIRRQQNDRNNIAQAAATLAMVALAQDRLGEASALISESIKLRRELGENIGIAQSNLIYSDILVERNQAAAAEQAAREAEAGFRRASASTSEAEAALAIARAQLARGEAAAAGKTLNSAEKLLRDSNDKRLLLRRDATLGRIQASLGQTGEASAVLDQALAQAEKIGQKAVAFEIRLAGSQAGRAAELQAEARQAGFLLIARKAR